MIWRLATNFMGISDRSLYGELWRTFYFLKMLSLFLLDMHIELAGFPGGTSGKEPTCNGGGVGSVPGSGRSPGEGHGNPLQYSGLENPMDRGAWWATVHGVTHNLATEQQN